MSQISLPNMPDPITPPPPPPATPATARVIRPVRDQREWVEQDMDSLLHPDHPARAIWAMLEGMDLDAFYADIKAVLDRPGHPASDPQVLLALWVYATVDGVGSARRLDRLCHEHDAYRWLRGGVPVNYHMLSDFRVAHQREMDDLLTNILASMMTEDLVTLRHVAQDGMRTRAGGPYKSACPPTPRGKGSLVPSQGNPRCVSGAGEGTGGAAGEGARASGS